MEQIRYCKSCHQELPLESFPVSRNYYEHTCKQCWNARKQVASKSRKAKGLCLACGAPAPTKANGKRYAMCQSCRNHSTEVTRVRRIKLLASGLCWMCGQQSYREGHKNCDSCQEMKSASGKKTRVKRASMGMCPKCGKQPKPLINKWCEACLTDQRTYQRQQRDALLRLYGGKCTCCGEDNFYFLNIDHVNNDGAQHRRQMGSHGASIRAILREGYKPDRYQVLCCNCNSAKEHYSSCPHTWDIITPLKDNVVKFRSGKRTGTTGGDIACAFEPGGIN